MADQKLARASVTDLARKPGELVDRVLAGERFVVYRHRRPVATLQPLNGCVVQPCDGAEHDVMGSPVGSASDEVDKLSAVQQALLLDGISLGRIVTSRWSQDRAPSERARAIEDLILRGLGRKSTRGTILTGRGMVLRGELFVRDGRAECDWVR